MEKQKRERSVNFTQEETDLLVSLVESKKHIIENKKNGSAAWQEKEKAWNDIQKVFNSSRRSVFRNHKHLKVKYESMKKDIRKKTAMIRAEGYQTGGGTNTTPVLNHVEQKVKEMMLLSVEGNESCSDSDSVVPNASNDIIIEIQNQDSEHPRKEVCEKSQEKGQCKPKDKRVFDKLIEEKCKIARIRKKLMTEELKQKIMQRKVLEKELAHKDVIHELEKQHLLLKIELLKKDLGEK